MKKTYINPELLVVKIQTMQMLAISITDDSTGIKITDNEGETDTMDARAGFWDDED